MTNILYVDWLSSSLVLREYDTSQQYGDRAVRSQKALKLIYDLLSVQGSQNR